VPLGFDLSAFAQVDDGARAAARQALGLAAGRAVVTTVGRLTAIKQQRLFLETAAALTRCGREIDFLIAGNGELRAELERTARDLGVADRVRFLGWRRDLATMYAATDVFLLTSRNEGTPVALIEAMAAGCAGVSTDVGGVRDVVPDDRIGRVAPFGDVHALANHVRTLIDNPELRRGVAESGRRYVLDHFNLDRLLDDIDDLYHSLRRGDR
jgi:glycosyltransferase involved in cell wall biosynthesis